MLVMATPTSAPVGLPGTKFNKTNNRKGSAVNNDWLLINYQIHILWLFYTLKILYFLISLFILMCSLK